jgi:hypothetical protein
MYRCIDVCYYNTCTDYIIILLYYYLGADVLRSACRGQVQLGSHVLQGDAAVGDADLAKSRFQHIVTQALYECEVVVCLEGGLVRCVC